MEGFVCCHQRGGQGCAAKKLLLACVIDSPIRGLVGSLNELRSNQTRIYLPVYIVLHKAVAVAFKLWTVRTLGNCEVLSMRLFRVGGQKIANVATFGKLGGKSEKSDAGGKEAYKVPKVRLLYQNVFVLTFCIAKFALQCGSCAAA